MPYHHPPCTPEASCQPMRCHPTAPPCPNPEKCIKVSRSKGLKPCPSAVSVLSTRSQVKCNDCGRFKSKDTNEAIQKWLKEKNLEAKLKKEDELTGSHKYMDYIKKKGTPRAATDCCAGHGHRGRLKKGGGSAGSEDDGGGKKRKKKKRKRGKGKGGCIIL